MSYLSNILRKCKSLEKVFFYYRFASLCVAEILKLYTGQLNEALSDASTSTAIPPESVLVIGHSIGGLVARLVLFPLKFIISL